MAEARARRIAGRFEVLGAVGGALRGRDVSTGLPVLVESVPAPRAHRRLTRMLLALAHPRLARVVAVVPEGARLWIATELPDGAPIDAPLDVDAARRLAADVAAGLTYLHERGLGHGGLRAASVLETEAGWVVVDVAGVVLGRGTPRTDERDDVAGLAGLVYEAVAGAPPFQSPAEDLPGELRAPLLRCLQNDRRRRFGTVREAAAAMGAALPERPPRKARWPWLALPVVLAAAALAVPFRPRELAAPPPAPAPRAVAPPVPAAPRRPTLAQAPFSFDDPRDAWLARAVPELLGLALEDASAVDLAGAGAELRLEGSIDREGDLTWLDVRLAETAGGAFVFAERIPLPASAALISVLDGMVARARQELAPGAAPARPLAALATPSAEALSAYLAGDFDRALAADPAYAAPRLARARQAPAQARALLAALPAERTSARTSLEAAVLIAGSPDERIAAWSAMRARFPRDPRIAAELAAAHRAAGRPADCAREAESITPPPPLLAWCRLEAGDPAGALAAARAGIGDEARLAAGDLALMQGRYGEARVAYAALPDALAKARLALVAVHAAGRCRINALLRPGWEPEIARSRVAAAVACGEWPVVRELEGRARRAGEIALADRWAAARRPLVPERISPVDRYALFDAPVLLEVARARLTAGDVEEAGLACAEIRGAAPAYAPGILCEGWVAEARGEWGGAFRSYRDFLDRWADADPENRLLRDGLRRIAQVVRKARESR